MEHKQEPGGLTEGQKYFVSVSGANMSLHVSEEDATESPAANVVTITTDGTAGFKVYKDEDEILALTLNFNSLTQLNNPKALLTRR